MSAISAEIGTVDFDAVPYENQMAVVIRFENECPENSFAYVRRNDDGEVVFISPAEKMGSHSAVLISPLVFSSNYAFRAVLGCYTYRSVVMYSLATPPGREYLVVGHKRTCTINIFLESG